MSNASKLTLIHIDEHHGGYNSYNSRVMICYNCKSEITSKHHYNKCDTICMFGCKSSNYSKPDFKPMMTFGLNGCSALVMINQTTNQIFFGHHPELSQIISWFNLNYNQSDQFIIIVKSPGDWVKTNEQYIMVSNSEQKIKNVFTKPNVNLILEPYDTFVCRNQYESLLYLFKKSDNIVYTNNYGQNIVLFKFNSHGL
jgi:hypothetical protein